MNFILLAVVILGLVHRAYGLDCYTCDTTHTQPNYNGEDGSTGNCFTIVPTTSTGPTPTQPCPADTTGVIHYCRTKFTILDGVTTAVVRGCAASNVDEDKNTAAVPGADKCTTGLDTSVLGNPTDTTTCYFHCTTANCNTKTDPNLKPCYTDCNKANIPIGGNCNYITGNCVCNTGFIGHDCTTIATLSAQRSCIQCNSLTDETGCSSTTASSACPGYETYCSTATTNIYDSSFNIVRTVSTRGCTSAHVAVDKCAFTDIYHDDGINDATLGYKEFTCYSTCDTDGCNTNTADGVINGNEAVVLRCVQCSISSGNFDESCKTATYKSVCASGTTHCKSTVTYLISKRTDVFNTEEAPTYELASVVRECATAGVTSECTTSSIGTLSLNKVTCTETCQTDGCNTGWPARPKCISCTSTSSSYGDGFDECAENPPDAAACTFPYQAYCVLQESGIDKSNGRAVKGYPHRVVRGCNHFDIGTICLPSTKIRETEMEACNRTCTTDGCNVGSGGNMPLQNMAAVIAPIIVGWLAQYL